MKLWFVDSLCINGKAWPFEVGGPQAPTKGGTLHVALYRIGTAIERSAKGERILSVSLTVRRIK